MNRISRFASCAFGFSCALALLAVLGGCASKPEIVPSKGPRQPTLASQVKIYEEQPQKYELLGSVMVTREEGAKWDERSNANAAFDNALAKAAAVGANGLLIGANPGEYDARVTVGYHGKFYQVPVRGRPPVGMFQAIYVLKE